MAGSYRHVTNERAEFSGMDLIDHLGDAHEALEECVWMIRNLAGGDRHRIFEAQRAYVAAKDGCNNPEYAKKMTFTDFWKEETHQD